MIQKQIMPAGTFLDDPVARDLFDTLMETIEPRLMTGRKKQTAEEMKDMTPEERGKLLEHFQDAMADFYEKWPTFVEESKAKLKKLGKYMRSEDEKSQDEGKLEELGDALDNYSEDHE